MFIVFFYLVFIFNFITSKLPEWGYLPGNIKLSYKHVTPLLFLRVYASLPAQAQLGNVLGLTVIVLAGIVVFVVTNDAFKRVDTEEGERVSLIKNDKEWIIKINLIE